MSTVLGHSQKPQDIAMSSLILSRVSRLDLPQVDCERASENEGRSRATRAKVARRVDLFRLRNIEFNLHIVGAKKPQEQSTGCTGLSYSKITS